MVKKKVEPQTNLDDILKAVHSLPERLREPNPLYKSMIDHVIEGTDKIVRIDVNAMGLKEKTVLHSLRESIKKHPEYKTKVTVAERQKQLFLVKL